MLLIGIKRMNWADNDHSNTLDRKTYLIVEP